MSPRSRARMGVAVGLLALALLAANLLLVWTVDAAGSAGRPPAATLWLLGLAGAPVVGTIIVGRRPGNTYGWLLLSFGITSSLLELTELYALYAIDRYGEAGAAGVAGALISQTLWGATIGHIPLLLLLFPDGKLPSPRWRWLRNAVVFLTATGSLAALFIRGELGEVPARNPIGAPGSLGIVVQVLVAVAVIGIFAAMIPAAGSLFARRRTATPQERLQLRWFSWAAAVLAIALLASALSIEGTEGTEIVVNLVLMLALMGLFAAIGIAVLRYRLYDIDRIISRTVSYVVLTVVLGVVYVVAVTALTTATANRAGDSPLAVAAATLAAAAAFGPARRRIQGAVDRRFNRARYDAAVAVEHYRLRLRDEIDVASLATDLTTTVSSTLQPRRVSLWLVPHEQVQP